MIDSIIDPQLLSYVDEYIVAGIFATNYYFTHTACPSWDEALKKIASWKQNYLEKFKDIPNEYTILAGRETLKSATRLPPFAIPVVIPNLLNPLYSKLYSKYIKISFKVFYTKDGKWFEEKMGNPIVISVALLPKSIKEKIAALNAQSADKIEVDITDEVNWELELEQELADKSRYWKDVRNEFAEIRTQALAGFKNTDADKYYKFMATRQDYSKYIEISYKYCKEKGKGADTMLLSQLIFTKSLPQSVKEKIGAKFGKSADKTEINITDEMNRELAKIKN